MRPTLALVVVAILAGVSLASSNLLDRAEAELEKDLFKRTLNGATSPKFNRKKVTLTYELRTF